MAQNFLYMFEFVVDDLLITRPNYCAPEEYPTCCEISFRSSVFVSICDREFGHCVDMCSPKCGKCCVFSLESPITDKDRLLIHVYKKKTDSCKFLVGATDLPIKSLFDKVTESFDLENPNWMVRLAKKNPDPRSPSKTAIVDNDCDEENMGRPEQLCPTSELTKRLLPLFNMKGKQTGNVVIIMRLVCNGPQIVSSFPFARVCSTNCGKKPKKCPSATLPALEGANKGQFCKMPDPCKNKDARRPSCQRYFACNADKGCPCEDCEDDCDREKPLQCPPPCPPKCPPKCPPTPCPPKKSKKASRNSSSTCMGPELTTSSEKGCTCDECVDECEADEGCEEISEVSMQPCFVSPTKTRPGPEAFEEFEACLNGSGLVIRVLKDTHQVQSVDDGNGGESSSEGDKCQKESENSQCECFNDVLKRSAFARNEVKRRTAGNIVNNPKIPKIRANIKYAGNDCCCPENYDIPFGKAKQKCANQENKLEQYRRKRPDDCGIIVPGNTGVQDTRSCCLQVDPNDIKDALKGINANTSKRGIEVCYKTCDDTDSDVFLIKLGSKKHCQNKKESIEIELKTPKQPIVMSTQKKTIETQINEVELDAALSGGCGAKGKGKGKGKKGKKGRLTGGGRNSQQADLSPEEAEAARKKEEARNQVRMLTSCRKPRKSDGPLSGPPSPLSRPFCCPPCNNPCCPFPMRCGCNI